MRELLGLFFMFFFERLNRILVKMTENYYKGKVTLDEAKQAIQNEFDELFSDPKRFFPDEDFAMNSTGETFNPEKRRISPLGILEGEHLADPSSRVYTLAERFYYAKNREEFLRELSGKSQGNPRFLEQPVPFGEIVEEVIQAADFLLPFISGYIRKLFFMG